MGCFFFGIIHKATNRKAEILIFMRRSIGSVAACKTYSNDYTLSAFIRSPKICISADTIAQKVQWSSNTPTTFAVFSATGVLVKTFVAIPQSAEDSFKALQVPHGTYYLKDLKSNYIKKVVK
ncbi:MAG: hypothetical protein IJM92_19865 [Fibrobacter sp.]|uniref:hypothetical protein n=1 Tax=Fibrobacter sp. TaxID=35828 RepID=UPI0025B8DAD2|nr:hypothetical protein [Fibrobacter sp.]MBQ7081872.1 hypothetical protein [Fibrobacter sp.]